MKAQIHPKWYPQAQVACACGNKFITGSTQEKIHVEVCSNCHPFYTGQMRYVDSAGRVDRFRDRMQNLDTRNTVSKHERRQIKRKQKVEEELSKPTSLEEVRKSLKAA